MRRVRTTVFREQRNANRLHRPEQQHPARARQEEHAAPRTVDHEARAARPEQVPDLQDPVDEELRRRVRDADRVEDLVEVVRDEPVARPLREESDRDDDTHALPVAGRREEGLPADVGGDGAVELDCRADLFVFVLDKRVLVIAVGVVVGERLQGLGIFSFAHEPTRRLGDEPDEEDLQNGRDTLQ
eukprot:PLAT9429.2.p2 GENE.PLAT9429.2~~PLAT9429.2.p2  ORF type:complete len:186 (-),score=4.42 PLAT9429.2:655-1212(-)